MKKIITNEITFGDYLNHSGTQSLENIYKLRGTKFSKIICDKYGFREVKEPKVIIIYD